MAPLSELEAVALDSYHGIEIADPFRWLEDRSNHRTDQWVKSQQSKAIDYFARASTYEHLSSQLVQRLDIDVLDEPVSVAGKEFCRLRRKGHARASICFKERGSDPWQVLLDAEQLEQSHSLNLYRISADGSILAFLQRVGGSDQACVRFMDVGTRSVFEADLGRGYPRGLILSPSRHGFFYCHEAPSGIGPHQICFRSFLADSSHTIVFERPRLEGSRLILAGEEDCLGALYAYERGNEKFSTFSVSDSGEATWTQVLDDLPPSSVPIIRNKRLYLLARGRVGGFAFSERDREGGKVRELASCGSGDVRGVAITATHLYIGIQHEMTTQVQYWSLANGQIGRLAAAPSEAIRLVPSPINDDAAYFSRESYTRPPEIFRHTGDACHSVSCSMGDAVEETPIFRASYVAKDGTSVPVTLIGRSDSVALQPVVVLVYGAFGSSLLPQFSVLFHLLIETGAVLAMLHVRGGGEKGSQWHDAGKRRNKPVSVSDVIDGIEWLQRQSFVDPNRIALYGASAGGLLVASVAVRIPEQLRAVVCIGPLLDMLRYDKFGLARRWEDEFGTSESDEDFNVLLSYSPYHNVRQSLRRPAFLFVTGDEDDRCDPAHVRKMAAVLMETASENQMVLVDYSPTRGHTPGLTLHERVTTLARRCAFLAKELDLDVRGGQVR